MEAVTSLGRNRSGKEKGEPDNSKESAQQKTEADREDIRTLLDWGKGLKTPSPSFLLGKERLKLQESMEILIHLVS